MKLIRGFCSFLMAVLISGAAFATLSPECVEFTDCDHAVACEIVLQVEAAASGLTPDYNKAAARAVAGVAGCGNYPNKFKLAKMDIAVSTTPPVNVVVDWSVVKNILISGGPDAGNVPGNDNGGAAPGDVTDEQLINTIVSAIGFDTVQQKQFLTALVTDYVAANKRDETTRLDDAYVLNFLGTGDNFDKYRSTVITFAGKSVVPDFGVDINWDDVLIEASMVLDENDKKMTLLVCENNRSWQWTIDAIGWAITAVAAVFTVYAGGAGGMAVASGRAAVGMGLKAAAKGIAKVGGKAAAKRMSKAGSKQLAKSAVKLRLKKNMRGWVNYKGKGVLQNGVKTFVKQAKENMKSKTGLLLGAGVAVYHVGQSSGWGTAYSLIDSDATKDIVNCQDVDHNEGCYTVCGDGNGTDDLNTKAFKPILGKAYCVGKSDYKLYEIRSNGSQGNQMVITKSQWNRVMSKIKSDVAEKGKCDWNEDDIDVYAGFFLHDPDTLNISTGELIIDQVVRIDD